MDQRGGNDHLEPFPSSSIAADANGDPASSRPPWRRVLYETQPYPDWYFPETETAVYKHSQQLADGKNHEDRGEDPTALSIAVALSPLNQNVNVIFVFLEVFRWLEQGQLNAIQLTLGCCGSLALGTLAYNIVQELIHSKLGRMRRTRSPKRSSQEVVSFAILLILLYALSPVLKTLTDATTSDTIYPLALMLFALHICLADNVLRPTPKARLGKTDDKDIQGEASRSPSRQDAISEQPQLFSALSLNAATAASLVLASRLPSQTHVFSLMFASIVLFALFPIYTRRLQHHLARLATTVLLIPIAIWTTWGDSTAATVLICLMNVFVLLVVPFWMKAATKGRRRLAGPWNVAKPKLRRRSYSAL